MILYVLAANRILGIGCPRRCEVLAESSTISAKVKSFQQLATRLIETATDTHKDDYVVVKHSEDYYLCSLSYTTHHSTQIFLVCLCDKETTSQEVFTFVQKLKQKDELQYSSSILQQELSDFNKLKTYRSSFENSSTPRCPNPFQNQKIATVPQDARPTPSMNWPVEQEKHLHGTGIPSLNSAASGRNNVSNQNINPTSCPGMVGSRTHQTIDAPHGTIISLPVQHHTHPTASPCEQVINRNDMKVGRDGQPPSTAEPQALPNTNPFCDATTVPQNRYDSTSINVGVIRDTSQNSVHYATQRVRSEHAAYDSKIPQYEIGNNILQHNNQQYVRSNEVAPGASHLINKRPVHDTSGLKSSLHVATGTSSPHHVAARTIASPRDVLDTPPSAHRDTSTEPAPSGALLSAENQFRANAPPGPPPANEAAAQVPQPRPTGTALGSAPPSIRVPIGLILPLDGLSFSPSSEREGISSDRLIESITEQDRALLQEDLGSAVTRTDFMNLFLRHAPTLENISLPRTFSSVGVEQALKDVKRERLVINGRPVAIDREHQLREVLQPHLRHFAFDPGASEALVSDILQACSRTASGGDAFFVVAQLFRSPDLLVVTGRRDPGPILVDIMPDGTASFTTRSNFELDALDHEAARGLRFDTPEPVQRGLLCEAGRGPLDETDQWALGLLDETDRWALGLAPAEPEAGERASSVCSIWAEIHETVNFIDGRCSRTLSLALEPVAASLHLISLDHTGLSQADGIYSVRHFHNGAAVYGNPGGFSISVEDVGGGACWVIGVPPRRVLYTCPVQWGEGGGPQVPCTGWTAVDLAVPTVQGSPVVRHLRDLGSAPSSVGGT